MLAGCYAGEPSRAPMLMYASSLWEGVPPGNRIRLMCGCRKCRHLMRPVNTRGGVGPRQQGQPSAQPDEDQIEQTK
jgi:hypothetical protein